jgi:hypothetical protein
MSIQVLTPVDTPHEVLQAGLTRHSRLRDSPLRLPEKLSIAITLAAQFKTFYWTCSALYVFLRAILVELSTSNRILTPLLYFAIFGVRVILLGPLPFSG